MTYAAPIALTHYRLPRPGSKLAFGFRRYQRPDGSWHFHQGVDMPAPRGTPLYAVDGGVIEQCHGGDGPVRGFDGYGRCVVVRFTSGLWGLYAHMERVDVRTGDIVVKGQQLGTVGGTAFRREAPAHQCGPHLHFELAATRYPKPRDRKPADWGRVNPAEWLLQNVHAGNGAGT